MKQVTRFFADHFLKLCLAFLILGAGLYVFYPFMSALLMGAMLAMALSPLRLWLEKKGLGRNKSLNVLIGGALVLVIAPTVSFFMRGSKLVAQYFRDEAFLAQLKEAQAKISLYFHDLAPLFGLKSEDLNLYIDNITDRVTGFLGQQFGGIMSEVPDLALFTVIMWISIYYFLNKESEIRAAFDQHINMSQQKRDRFVIILKSISQSVFFSNVLTGVIQASLVTMGSLIFGVGDWFLVFFITFIASFIPIVGAGPIAFILALYSFAIDQQAAGVGMVIVAVLAGAIDNVLRPFLATSKEAEVPALLSLLAVLGGVTAFGLKGLFLGPFVASLAFSVLPLILSEVFGEETRPDVQADVAVVSQIDQIE